MSKDKPYIAIEGHSKNTIAELPISKFATPNVEKEFLHLDKLPDGTWRLLFNVNDDSGNHILVSAIKSLRIVREEA